VDADELNPASVAMDPDPLRDRSMAAAAPSVADERTRANPPPATTKKRPTTLNYQVSEQYGNRVDTGVLVAHGLVTNALVRACEDYFYNFDPWVDVPVAAAEVLGEGLMSPALIDLACLRHNDRFEICTLIPQVFSELG
jgi:hypothetical protein